jgi:hypothetical protein
MNQTQYDLFLKSTQGTQQVELTTHLPQYNTNFQEQHPAQNELVQWLQAYQFKNGFTGKRSRDESNLANDDPNLANRRKLRLNKIT